MATEVEVHYVEQRSHEDAHQRIVGVGGTFDRVHWKVSGPQAIAAIRSGAFRFYVTVGTREVDLVVACHEGRHYLKTSDDGRAPDLLLALPSGPNPEPESIHRVSRSVSYSSELRCRFSLPIAIPPVFGVRRRLRGRWRRSDR